MESKKHVLEEDDELEGSAHKQRKLNFYALGFERIWQKRNISRDYMEGITFDRNMTAQEKKSIVKDKPDLDFILNRDFDEELKDEAENASKERHAEAVKRNAEATKRSAEAARLKAEAEMMKAEAEMETILLEVGGIVDTETLQKLKKNLPSTAKNATEVEKVIKSTVEDKERRIKVLNIFGIQTETSVTRQSQKALLLFKKACKDIELKENKFFDTKDDLREHSSRQKVFIREEFKVLIDKLLGLSEIKSSVLCGSPGIGKTLLGLIVCCKLIKNNEKFVRVLESGAWLCFNGQDVSSGHGIQNIPIDWRDDSCWLLIDGSVKDVFLTKKKKGMVFASPKKSNYHNFLKTSEGSILYLGDWKWEEIEAFVNESTDEDIHKQFSATFMIEDPDMKELHNKEYLLKIFKQRFHVVGGKTRLLFSGSQTTEQMKKIVDQAISLVNLKDLVKICFINITDYIPSILYGIRRGDDFFSYSIDFSSIYVAQNVNNAIVRSTINDRKKMYAMFRDSNANGATKGILYEALCHEYFSTNGTEISYRKLQGVSANLNEAYLEALGKWWRSRNSYAGKTKAAADSKNIQAFIKNYESLKKVYDDFLKDHLQNNKKRKKSNEIAETWHHFMFENIIVIKYSTLDEVIQKVAKIEREINPEELPTTLYCIPRSSQQETFDSIAIKFENDEEDKLIKKLIIFQMTVGESHSYNPSIVQDCVDGLKIPLCAFIFVVPPERINDFKLKQASGDGLYICDIDFTAVEEAIESNYLANKSRAN